MQDIINDSKDAQLDDRDTFLGIGQNRWETWRDFSLLDILLPGTRAQVHLPERGKFVSKSKGIYTQSCIPCTLVLLWSTVVCSECQHQKTRSDDLIDLNQTTRLVINVHLEPVLKLHQANDECIIPCRLVKWDMRDPHGVVQEMSSPIVTPIGGKDYSRGTNFNCMATSGLKTSWSECSCSLHLL